MHKYLFICLLLLSGCATNGCSCAAPALGIMTDAAMQVVHVARNGAAEKAGMQVGDVLVDVRLAQLAPGESGDPVPFSEIEAAKSVTSRSIAGGCCPSVGRSVRLRVQRGEQLVELYITPSLTGDFTNDGYKPGDPTPTPVPSDWYSF